MNGWARSEGATVTGSQALFHCVASALLAAGRQRNELNLIAQRSTRNVRLA
jgi:hypothetical protein